MKNASDDNQVVTRKILKEELERKLSDYPTKDDLKRELAAYPTKDDLKRELAAYPTKDDLKRELAAYPTKDDLKRELAAYATKDDLKREVNKLQDTDQRIINALLDFKDEVNRRFDEVNRGIQDIKNTLVEHMGEMQTHRDERIILSHQNSRNTKRIEKLEKKVFGAIQTN